jgi:hypothetical protein
VTVGAPQGASRHSICCSVKTHAGIGGVCDQQRRRGDFQRLWVQKPRHRSELKTTATHVEPVLVLRKRNNSHASVCSTFLHGPQKKFLLTDPIVGQKRGALHGERQY